MSGLFVSNKQLFEDSSGFSSPIQEQSIEHGDNFSAPIYSNFTFSSAATKAVPVPQINSSTSKLIVFPSARQFHHQENSSQNQKRHIVTPDKSRAAKPVQDPFMVKRISDYLVSLNKPWAYRTNAIWCLGVTTGCRISTMVRIGSRKTEDGFYLSDETPLYIGDIMESKTKFKTRITLHEKKTGKYMSPKLTPFAIDALWLYLRNCRKGFELTDPLFIGQKDDDRAICEHTVNGNFDAVEKALDIKTQFSSHSMRHTYVYFYTLVLSIQASEGTIPIHESAFKLASYNTGHVNTQLTQEYSGLAQPVSDAVGYGLSDLFQNPYKIEAINKLVDASKKYDGYQPIEISQ